MSRRGEEEDEHHQNPFLSLSGGKASSSKLQFSFLAERGALRLFCSDDKVLAIGDLYKKIAQEKNGCCWEAYEAYRRLKSLGYIIGRHGIPWIIKENKSFSIGSQQAMSSAAETLDPDVEYKISTLFREIKINEMKPIFEVYPPNSKFKKSSPGDPIFLLCVLKVNPPLRHEVEYVERYCGGIPIKFCIVEHGQISFFSFDMVALPVLP